VTIGVIQVEIRRFAQCGSLESSDLLVQIKPNEGGLALDIESKVAVEYGTSLDRKIREILARYEIDNAHVHIQDQGALDFAIEARLETALKRASSKEGEQGV
jgi:citrate lyase subunit gamma (acyl carrier protein)